MRVSQRTLRRWYNLYNRKYFGNRLPKDIKIGFKNFRAKLIGECTSGESIYINTRVRWSKTICKATLLHEMVHLELPDHMGHGVTFQKRMLQLARAGAMKKLWLKA